LNNLANKQLEIRFKSDLRSKEEESDFLGFLKFDLKRKIKKEDISFASTCHDIYNPVYSSDEEVKEDVPWRTFSAILKSENKNFSSLFDSRGEMSTDVKIFV
jgi:hypothetical protein